MHFPYLLPAALLISSAVASPLHQLDKKQIGSLGSILPLVKGIMKQKGSKSGVTAPASEEESCADAIGKINDALKLSASFMRASEEKPTIRDIQAVLIVLESSLGDECKGNDQQSQKRDDGPLGILGGGGGDDGVLGIGVLGDNDGKEDSDTEYCEQDDDEQHVERSSPNVIVARQEECSRCERQLHNIVKQLQVIISLGQGAGSSAQGDGVQSAVVPVATGLNATATGVPRRYR